MRTKPIATGTVYGRLTVVMCIGTNKHRARRYLCNCKCGSVHEATGGDLHSGRVSSCGCLKRERTSEASKGENNAGYIHGGSGTKLHRLWRGMQERCEDPKHISYAHYGAKGVSVCLAWKNYAAFREWATAKGYKDGMSIDRINTLEGYRADNCEIVTRAENTARGNRARSKQKKEGRR